MSDIDQDYMGRLTVTRRAAAAEGIVSLTLAAADGAPLPGWTAGAHIDIGGPDGRFRQYSLCGDVCDHRSYTVAVLREEQGVCSSWLHDKTHEESQLEVRGPRNHFPLLAAKNYVFIAGGIGITPILAMIRQAEREGSTWTLHYGGRTRSSMAFTGDLAVHPGQVHLVPQDEYGLLDLPAILGEVCPDTLVYCCGPEPLITAVESAIAHWPAGSLHVERFKPREIDRDGPERSFTVRCEASDLTLTVPPESSVIEVLLAAGIDIPSSCSEGTCGTCETDVLEGEPDHRDSILSEAERATNETMMVCVSRCKGDLLVLDV